MCIRDSHTGDPGQKRLQIPPEGDIIRVQREGEGKDKSRDSQLHRLQPHLHGIFLRNTGRRVGGNRHRRRDRRDGREIQQEQVRRQNRQPKSRQSGRNGGGADNVGRRGGQAHAQDRAHQHGQNQAGDQGIAAQLHNEVGEFKAQAGQGEHRHHNSRSGTGRHNGTEGFSGRHSAVHNPF